MFSPSLQNLLIQAHIEELERQAAATRSRSTGLDQPRSARQAACTCTSAAASDRRSIRRFGQLTRRWPRSCSAACPC